VVPSRPSTNSQGAYPKESTRPNGRSWWSAWAGTVGVVNCSTGSKPPSRRLPRLAAAECGSTEASWASREEPGDFDACWENDGVDLDALDPVILDLSAGRAAQKSRYGGELFPNIIEAEPGLVFAEFFQNERDTGRKGIVVLASGGRK
jgi:hypothetical protein